MYRKLVDGLYKWLPILCLCHCRPDRSFFFRGRQFPVCARCTGVLTGMVLSLFTFPLWAPPAWVSVLLLLPMLADGMIQQLTRYESRNFRRLWTGLLFGCGSASLFLLSVAAVCRLGRMVGEKIFDK